MSAHDLDLTPRPSDAPRRAHWTYERRASDPVILPMRRSRRGAALAAVVGIGVGLGIVALWGTHIAEPEPMLGQTTPIESRAPELDMSHYDAALSERAMADSLAVVGSPTMTEDREVAMDEWPVGPVDDAIDPRDAVPTSGSDAPNMSIDGSAEPVRADFPTPDPRLGVPSEAQMGVRDNAREEVGSDSASASDDPYATGRPTRLGEPAGSSDNPY